MYRYSVPITLIVCLVAFGGCDIFSGQSSSPEDKLVDGVALRESDKSGVSVVATHKKGDWMVGLSGDNKLASGVVYGTGEGTRIAASIDKQGRPDTAVVGKNILTFENFNGNKADVTVINTETEETETLKQIDIGVNFNNLEISNSKNKSKRKQANLNTFELIGFTAGAISCTAAVALGGSGFACLPALAQVASEATERSASKWSKSAEALGFGLDVAGCKGLDPSACISALSTAAETVWEESKSLIEENETQLLVFKIGTFEGHEYYASKPDVTRNWNEARDVADKLGGHLVTISNQEEENFVIPENVEDFKNNFWIGLTDRENEGNFEWITNEEINYTNWCSGEPNDLGTEDAVILRLDAECWNDGDIINDNRGFAIEIE